MKKLYLCTIAYLYLPLVIFVLGWTTLWIGIPVIAATIGALYFCYRKLTDKIDDTLRFKGWEILLFFLLIFIVFIILGQGDLFAQDTDWNKHHAILYDLVNFKWPVVYQNDVMLTYYFGQYIVPAFIGKIFGNSCVAALWAMAIWCAIGVTITFIHVCQMVKATSFPKKIGVLLILIFWSGATNLGTMIYQHIGHPDIGLTSYKWIDLNRIRVHFASNLNTLRCDFQHIIVPWISCCIFLRHKKEYAVYIMLALPLLFSASFGFVYFSLLLAAYFLWNVLIEKQHLTVWKQAFVKENILLLPITAVILIFLAGNVFGEKSDLVGFDFLNMFTRFDFYLVFIAVEFVLYMIFLFHEHRKNILFYFILGELLLIPFISLGLFNDLCSRGSIPARFILMIMCIEQFYTYGLKNWRNIAIAVIFLFGACNSWTEVQETAAYSLDSGLGSEEIIQDFVASYDGWAENPSVRADDAYNYYTLHYSDSLFYKISRKNL